MVGAPLLTFAEKMRQLVEQRAEQRALPSGFMRCPLNPAHQVPVAAIVRHLEKTHHEDALALAPNAMYGSGTYTRRRDFIKKQLRRFYESDEEEENDDDCRKRRTGRRRRRRSYSTQCSCSSSGSCFSSQNSLPRVKKKTEVTHKKKEGELNSFHVNNNCFLSGVNKALYPQPTPPSSSQSPSPYSQLPQQQQQPLLPVVNWCGGHSQQIGEAFLNVPRATTTILGRYPLGCSIEWQSIINYLRQFGSLRRCEPQPLNATFTVDYDTVEATSRCLSASYPFVIIDGVKVELMQLTSGPKMALTASTTTTTTTPAVVLSANATPVETPSSAFQQLYSQAPPATVGNQQHHIAPHTQPPVITVAGRPVGVVLPGNGANGCAISHFSSTKKDRQIKAPKCVLLTTLKENNVEVVDEKSLFEEFVRFGEVVNIISIGPRILVEYESHEGVEKAALALKKHEKLFSLCAYLNEYDEIKP